MEVSYTTGEDRRTAFNINQNHQQVAQNDSVAQGGQQNEEGDDLSSDPSVCDVTRESFWPVAIRYQAEPLEVDIK